MGSKRTSQPVAACRPSAAGWLEALVELVELLGVEQEPHGPDGAAGEHLRVERGLHEVVLGGGQGGHDLAVGEVRGAPDGGQGDALGADGGTAAAGLCAYRCLGVGGPGHGAPAGRAG